MTGKGESWHTKEERCSDQLFQNNSNREIPRGVFSSSVLKLPNFLTNPREYFEEKLSNPRSSNL